MDDSNQDRDLEGVASSPDAPPSKSEEVDQKKTAGFHVNPYNQPRSVLGNEISANFFLKLTGTITDSFGQTLVKALETRKS